MYVRILSLHVPYVYYGGICIHRVCLVHRCMHTSTKVSYVVVVCSSVLVVVDVVVDGISSLKR